MRAGANHSHFRPVPTGVATIFLAWASFVFAGDVPAPVKADNLAVVLAWMRQAVGRPVLSGRPAELLIKGKVERAGLMSDFSLRFAPNGSFLETLASPLPGQLGFNGKVRWSTDLSGMPEQLELHDLDRNLLWMGMRTGQWLSISASAPTIALARAKSPRDEVVLDVKQGRFKAKVHVSRGTSLFTSLESSGVEGPETWTFTDHRRWGRLGMPAKVTQKQAGQTAIHYVISIDPAPAAAAGVYDLVSTRPDDTRFDPQAPEAVPLRRAMTGHVLVRPKVNGRDIGWFIFDTGAAGNVLDPKVLKELNLKPLGTAAVTSVGGNEPSSIVQATSIDIGPMSVTKSFLFHSPTVTDLHLLKKRKVTRMKVGPTDTAMLKK